MLQYKLDIDFEKLKRQKLELLEVIAMNDSKVFQVFCKKTEDALKGIVHLIDEIQDQAVDVHGIEENKVFN